MSQASVAQHRAPARDALPDNVVFEDHQPVLGDSRAEVIAGLRQARKQVNPKYFYDARGSELFEQITRVDEYYLTRTERAILQDHAAEMAALCGTDCVLIEPGAGSCEKVRLLLDSIRPAAYVPVDISAGFLSEAAQRLGNEFPWLMVHAVCADFSDDWHDRTRLPTGRRVVFYPGSTIGNMEPEVACEFLAGLRAWIGQDGGVLIGVDLHKSRQVLEAAYNDAEGVTEQFNRNMLRTINRIADADFDVNRFSHRARYDADRRRIEMHLVSDAEQTVNLGDETVHFRAGETLHTENSYKYDLDDFKALAAAAGYCVQRTWLDDQQLFSVHFLGVSESR